MVSIVSNSYTQSVTRGGGPYNATVTDAGTDPSAITLEIGRDTEWGIVDVIAIDAGVVTYSVPTNLPVRHYIDRYQLRITVGASVFTTPVGEDRLTLNPEDGMNWQNLGEYVDDPYNVTALFSGLQAMAVGSDGNDADQLYFASTTSPGNYLFGIDSSGFWAIDWDGDEPSDQAATIGVITHDGQYIAPAAFTFAADGDLQQPQTGDVLLVQDSWPLTDLEQCTNGLYARECPAAIKQI